MPESRLRYTSSGMLLPELGPEPSKGPRVYTKNTPYMAAFANQDKPEEVMASAANSKVATMHTFPSTADGFSYIGQSRHTMQILAYETSPYKTWNDIKTKFESLSSNLGDSFKEAYQQLKDQLTSGGIPDISAVGNSLSLLGQADIDYSELRNSRINQVKPEAIFTFYMPTPIIYRSENRYEEISLTRSISGGISSAASTEGLPTSGFKGKIAGALKAVDKFGSAAANALQMGGYPINPMIEILYENTLQRTFEYEFRFAPTSEAESISLKQTIERLRETAAPTRMAAGILWKAPDTYDIMFLHNGVENTNIPKVSECVMESIEVDYAPNDKWVTFRNGYPIDVRMRLAFRELDPIDRANVKRGW